MKSGNKSSPQVAARLPPIPHSLLVTAVVFGILVSHWSSNNIVLGRTEGPPAYVQAPLFLNPLYPLLSMMDDPDFRQFIYPASSWMLFAAMGCLAAAFAMRSLQRSGNQV